MISTELQNKILSHLPSVKSYCRNLYRRDNESAKDLCQTVMMKAFANPPGDESNIKGWLLSIVHNEFINEAKKRSKITAVGFEEWHGNYQPGNLFDQHFVEAQLCNHKQLAAYINGYKYHEIAENESMLINTVKTYIRRSRRQIREQIEFVNKI